MKKPWTANTLSSALAEIGRRGGLTTGETKRRGDARYYQALSRKAARARAKLKM